MIAGLMIRTNAGVVHLLCGPESLHRRRGNGLIAQKNFAEAVRHCSLQSLYSTGQKLSGLLERFRPPQTHLQ